MNRWPCISLSTVLKSISLAFLLSVFAALSARACNEDTLLQLIGSLEAPGGYDTVYYGVRTHPPRPITTMSVGEVLDWQRSTVRAGSVSSAAGQYQIIRGTLQGLVDQGIVSRSDTFDAATQDRLGRHLLRETGYRDGDASPETANRIARVWAALPRVSGPGAGASVYEGFAGNHSLVSADTYMGVLSCDIAVADVQQEADTIRRGVRIGFEWDRLLDQMVETAMTLFIPVAAAASGMLLTLFLVDLVLRGGQWAIGSRSLPGGFSSLVFRFGVVLLCMIVLMEPLALVDMIDGVARSLVQSDGGSFALSDFAAARMALVYSLFEGLASYPFLIQAQVQVTALFIQLMLALQIAAIVYWSFRLLLIGAAGLLSIAFGGLRETTGISGRYLRSLVASGFAIMAVLLVIGVFIDLAWMMRAELFPPAAAMGMVLLDVVMVVLLWMLPRTAMQIVTQE
ncbi:hypothetical protein GTA62_18470 [Roseobacter sp. HKCCD9010]|uniref:hypothetical protein n=1 Tax=unclassified Roseobacter TaxID=196798 RepID=UPI0014920A1E|nr:MULTISPECIES: hypothetical protein [unclassified Roseobacter]MBF9051904.1 hypothetical protein [Rhodobacterales bacterium HKCCD4356]NNV40306.1 hypothetical protein [Roseobacter sp. HKCCD9054]NNV48839.1 hypothetical protein [Roseobacter sp. HKCCD6265]NNV78640.1 hypothetical protein [Roseobacter sp. HKCCD6135]NNW38253.1 hypothetical protein [Roseobacter sp. HKCCD9117-2]NNW51122.1 hypothetical protein [Roseobacter sp. HKCCD9144]NNW59686.1 hypothetical protein [Roseobacter sp. HKCCD8629]NNW9